MTDNGCERLLRNSSSSDAASDRLQGDFRFSPLPHACRIEVPGRSGLSERAAHQRERPMLRPLMPVAHQPAMMVGPWSLPHAAAGQQAAATPCNGLLPLTLHPSGSNRHGDIARSELTIQNEPQRPSLRERPAPLKKCCRRRRRNIPPWIAEEGEEPSIQGGAVATGYSGRSETLSA